MPEQLGFHIDTSVCINCKACAIACADKNDLPVGVAWRRVLQYGGGKWVDRGGLPVPEKVFTYSLSVSCMHCEEPFCAEVCKEKAVAKGPDGVVRVNQKLCVGCRSCAEACPYNAPQFATLGGVMSKCDMCADLRAEGRNPACVNACSMRAIQFGPIEELKRRYGKVTAVEPLPEPRTGPSLVITPHADAEPSGKGTGRILSDLVGA